MRKEKRKWPKYAAMALTIVLLTGSVALVLLENLMPDQTYIPNAIVKIPSTVVSAMLKPLQGAFSWASHGVLNYLERRKLQMNIEIEYNRVLAENNDYAYKAMRNEELVAENESLRNLWKRSQEIPEMDPILAYVTARETGSWFQTFTVDVGENDGVEINMAVINTDGLVGYITAVHETSSEVISIIDSRARVAGVIQSTRDEGSVRGALGLGEETVCRMYNLQSDVVPRPNDIVVTSGQGTNPLPKGLRIGVIRESTRYVDENKRFVIIEPAVDFQHIEQVLVLRYEAPPEQSGAADPQAHATPIPLDTPRPYPSIGEQINDPNLGRVTAPPRPTRVTIDLGNPDPTQTPNPELDEELRQELEMFGDGTSDETEAEGEGAP